MGLDLSMALVASSDLPVSEDAPADFVPKTKIEAAVSDELLDAAVEAIVASASTGSIGDGKVFVSELIQATRIRTGETGDQAL